MQWTVTFQKNINSVLIIIGKGVAEWLLHSCLSTDLNGEQTVTRPGKMGTHYRFKEQMLLLREAKETNGVTAQLDAEIFLP